MEGWRGRENKQGGRKEREKGNREGEGGREVLGSAMFLYIRQHDCA